MDEIESLKKQCKELREASCELQSRLEAVLKTIELKTSQPALRGLIKTCPNCGKEVPDPQQIVVCCNPNCGKWGCWQCFELSSETVHGDDYVCNECLEADPSYRLEETEDDWEYFRKDRE